MSVAKVVSDIYENLQEQVTAKHEQIGEADGTEIELLGALLSKITALESDVEAIKIH